MKKIPIKIHTANALQWLGSLYRNPADAIKEHVSNAIDEHAKARAAGLAHSTCRINFKLEKDRVTISYPYGMSRQEFESALQRVADSAKKSCDFQQIGQLGIGMFCFFQIGSKCTFISKKSAESDAFRVTLRGGSGHAEFESVPKRESLVEPGIKIMISGLHFDPTKPRGPLSPARLQKAFAEKFDPYLKDGTIEISIECGGMKHTVAPLKIELPPIGKHFSHWPLTRGRNKKFTLELYFDPSGKGTVGIRHKGVTIVEDIRQLSAYGFEESTYAGGDIRGFIDADFLQPLPARTGFEDNDDWLSLLDELDRIEPSIRDEIGYLKLQEEEKKLTEIQKKAVEIARDILNTDEFKDMELLEGLGIKSPSPLFPPHGFDFVPPSKRIEIDKKDTIALKAMVPSCVPESSRVSFSISDSAKVALHTKEALLRSVDADKNGVVVTRVSVEGTSETSVPVILTATAGALRTEAYLRVQPSAQKRTPVSPGKEKEGTRINYVEKPFEDGPSKHSRYVARVIEINELSEDYENEVRNGPEKAQLAYAALMIGKETIAFNDKSGLADEYLEKMLSYYFKLRRMISRPIARRHKRQKTAASKKKRA